MGKVNITFNAGTIFGPGDSVDWELNYEVSMKQYERLIVAFKSGKNFDECEEVTDIYDEVYDAANEQATSDLLEYSYETIEEYIDEDSPNLWRADHVFEIRVNFPVEWNKIYEGKE